MPEDDEIDTSEFWKRSLEPAKDSERLYEPKEPDAMRWLRFQRVKQESEKVWREIQDLLRKKVL
jgi:hypothetical protein